MFGDSASDYGEVLTPVQGVKSPEPAPPQNVAAPMLLQRPRPSNTAAQRGIGASATIAAPTYL